MSTDPFFQQQQAIEQAKQEASRLKAMAEDNDKELNNEIEVEDEDQQQNDNENNEIDNDEEDKNGLGGDNKNDDNSDKREIEDKKGKNGKKGKGGKSGRGRNRSKVGMKMNNNGSVRTRIRLDEDLDEFDDDLDNLGNENDNKVNVRNNGGRKRQHSETDRRFDVLTDRLAAGDLDREDYIAIVKALGNDNGEKSSKGGKKMAKKKGKHGTIVCYIYVVYFHSECFSCFYC